MYSTGTVVGNIQAYKSIYWYFYYFMSLDTHGLRLLLKKNFRTQTILFQLLRNSKSIAS